MNKVKIYEVKAGSAELNAPKLLSPEGKYFYWDDKKFTNDELGDIVFFINRHAKWALFTKIGAKNISTRHDRNRKTTTFNHEYNSYTVSDPDEVFNTFLRFDIVQKVAIPDQWNWTKIIGQSETFDLRKEGLEGDTSRLSKIDDLQKIFQDGPAFDLLNECKNFLGGTSGLPLKSEILETIKLDGIQRIIKSEEFWFQLAKNKLQDLIDFSAPAEAFNRLAAEYKHADSFERFIQSLTPNSSDHRLMVIIGELIAYCDMNAANKNQYNLNDDKRVLALSFVRQNVWVDNLLRFKSAGNDVNAISSPAIKNAISYLINPGAEVTMLSENHRQMVSRYLLGQASYNKANFVNDLFAFFAPYEINPTNRINFSAAINYILYTEKVKTLWFESVEGLVACDNTGWLDDAIMDLKSHRYIVLWWDKKPSGGQAVLKLLKERIKYDGSFYIYYTSNQTAFYRSKIVDFAIEEDYENKNWNINDDVAWYQEQFSGYATEKKLARIAFLAEEVIKLAFPIPISKFEFYKHFTAPTQNNMQPYALLNEDMTVANIPETESTNVTILPVNESLSFNNPYRTILKAIQTKPFILLAGISGTGKSRLVRTLAYKTCALKELQGSSPGNFELIMVRPNWHDSSDLRGYLTRIDGTRYTSTSFLRFLVKAWKFPQIPFFLCLDEMNLAPVEQYFAEYLSLIETRTIENGQIITDSIIKLSDCESEKTYSNLLKELEVQSGSHLWNQFMDKGITLPTNLIVMGTVNMDETTHSFSRKVLDRAMTFEMNQVDLMAGLDETNTHWSYDEVSIASSLVVGNDISGGQVYKKFKEGIQVIDYLATLNIQLEHSPFKIAYRVRDEFLIYCYQNSLLQNLPSDWLDTCLDEMTHMKILSRIEGDESKAGSSINKLLDAIPQKFKRSHTKLTEMKNKLQGYGYTSYWS